ncbi:hypothetical protein ACHAW6_005835 [Cyclotella cf. meneghiniana]
MTARTTPTLTTVTYQNRIDCKLNIADDTCSVSTNQITSKNPFCDDFANHFYVHCVQPLNSLLSNPFHDEGFAKKERMLVEEAFRQERCAVIGGRGAETVFMEKHLRRNRIAERGKMRERQLAQMRAQAELKARRRFVESTNGGGNSLIADDGTHDSSLLGSIAITEKKAKSDTFQAEPSTAAQTEPESESRLAVPSLKDASDRVRNLFLHTAHQHVNKNIQQPMVAVKKVWNSPIKPSVNKKGFHVKPKVFSRQSKNGDCDKGNVDDDTVSLSNPPSESSDAGNDLIVTEISAREFPATCVTVDLSQKEHDSVPIVASARKALGRDTSRKTVRSNPRVDTETDECAAGSHGSTLGPKDSFSPLSSYEHQVFNDTNYAGEKRGIKENEDERRYIDKILTTASPWKMVPPRTAWDESVRPNVHHSNTSNKTETDQSKPEELMLDLIEDCATTESENQGYVGFCSRVKNDNTEQELIATLTNFENTRVREQCADDKTQTNTDVLSESAQQKGEDQHPDAKEVDLDMDALARSISEKYAMVMSHRISDGDRNDYRLSSNHDGAAIDAEKQHWVDNNERIQCRSMICGEKGRHSDKVYRITDGNSSCSCNTEPTDERIFTSNVIKMRNERAYPSTSYESLTRQSADFHESIKISVGDSVGIDSLSCNQMSHSAPELSYPSVISIPMRAQRSIENSPNSLVDESQRSDQSCRMTVDIHVPSVSSDSSSNRARNDITVAMLPCNEIGRSSFGSCLSHDAAKSNETYGLRMDCSMNPTYLTPRTMSRYENATTLNPDVVGNRRQRIIEKPQESLQTHSVANQDYHEEKHRAARLRRAQVDDTYYEMKPLSFSSLAIHDVANTSKLHGLSMNRHVNSSRRNVGKSIFDHESSDTLLEESDNDACNDLDYSAIGSLFSRDIKAKKLDRLMMIQLDGSNAIAAEQPGSLGSARDVDQDDEYFPCTENELDFNEQNTSSYNIWKQDSASGPEGSNHLVASGRFEKSTLSHHLIDGQVESGECFQCERNIEIITGDNPIEEKIKSSNIIDVPMRRGCVYREHLGPSCPITQLKLPRFN